MRPQGRIRDAHCIGTHARHSCGRTVGHPRAAMLTSVLTVDAASGTSPCYRSVTDKHRTWHCTSLLLASTPLRLARRLVIITSRCPVGRRDAAWDPCIAFPAILTPCAATSVAAPATTTAPSTFSAQPVTPSPAATIDPPMRVFCVTSGGRPGSRCACMSRTNIWQFAPVIS